MEESSKRKADRDTIRDLRGQDQTDRDTIRDLREQGDVDRALTAHLQAEGELDRDKIANLEAALVTARQIGEAMGVLMASQRSLASKRSTCYVPPANPHTAKCATSPTTSHSPERSR